MNWKTINSIKDIDIIIERSHLVPCLILKHSTSCPISAMAKHRLEGSWDIAPDAVEPYYLDLLRHRDISNYIASAFGVQHESPQVLLIKGGICTFDASHLDIRTADLRATAA